MFCFAGLTYQPQPVADSPTPRPIPSGRPPLPPSAKRHLPGPSASLPTFHILHTASTSARCAQTAMTAAQTNKCAQVGTHNSANAAAMVGVENCARADVLARQVRAFQLLVAMLPASNLVLLEALLSLLHQIATTPQTRMTSFSLGILFAPLILLPRTLHPHTLQQQHELFAHTVASLINVFPQLFIVCAYLPNSSLI